jgi:hypothetical protein
MKMGLININMIIRPVIGPGLVRIQKDEARVVSAAERKRSHEN